MYKAFYSGLESLALPLFALFFFTAAFTWVLVRVLRRKGSTEWEQASQLPLSDDLHSTHGNTP